MTFGCPVREELEVQEHTFLKVKCLQVSPPVNEYLVSKNQQLEENLIFLDMCTEAFECCSLDKIRFCRKD